MITKNTDFIQILSEHLKCEHSTLLLSSDVMALAQTHQVSSIVYYQIKDNNLYQSYLQSISAYTRRKSLIREITNAFTDITFYMVKGLSVSEYYPIPVLPHST